MCLLYVLWLVLTYMLFLFFFNQKTAYDMRISDCSSDFCSSDLVLHAGAAAADDHARRTDRGKLPADVLAGCARYHFCGRPALFCLGLRHFPAATNLQDRAARTGGSRPG